MSGPLLRAMCRNRPDRRKSLLDHAYNITPFKRIKCEGRNRGCSTLMTGWVGNRSKKMSGMEERREGGREEGRVGGRKEGRKERRKE